MSKTYNSDTYLKYQELTKYYKLHPIKYIKMIEGDFNVKLTLNQKILLYLYHIGILKTDYQKSQDNINKILKKYIKKR